MVMYQGQLFQRPAAIAAFLGAFCLFAGTLLHPMDQDPADTQAAFAEYATSHHWVWSHLLQLFGLTLMLFALLSLARILQGGRASGLTRWGSAAAIISLALGFVLQAVDGVALKRLVDAWWAADEARKAGFFYATYAARQIEIGLAAMLSLSVAMTGILLGVALIRSHIFPSWVGTLGLLGGIAMFLSGLTMAHTGFSAMSMALGMPANLLMLLWMLGLSWQLWKHGQG